MTAASDFDPPAQRNRWSLQSKAFAATLALVAYVLVSTFYVAYERTQLTDSILALDQLARHERSLALLETAINGANAFAVSGAQAPAQKGLLADLALHVENCRRQFAVLEEFDPGYALSLRAIDRSWQALRVEPTPANWADLQRALDRVHDDLEIRRARLFELRESLTRAYHRQYDAVTVESLLLVMFGAVVFGTAGGWFIGSLTTDIRRLEQHARQVVRGARGVKLRVRRGDELGALMHAVNRMAEDLDEREKRIELEARRRSHQDKMLTVGALAAGVAHEVNNPLAVISGLAQEWRHADVPPTPAELAEGAQLILAQIQRAAQAARHLAEAAAPEVSDYDLIDINAIVRRAVQLMSYDKRYRRIGFETQFDAALPAVRSSGTAVQQVLMQMLSLGCDALAAQAGTPSRVRIQTQCGGGEVEIALDFPPVVDFARGEVQRTLLLARASVEPLRGRLAFGQAEGDDLRIKLALPVEGGGGEG